MTSFAAREKAFEDLYAHDLELQFKISMRRNRLLGLWAAQALGRDDAETYAREVVMADFEEPGEEDVVRKVTGDFARAGKAIDTAELRLRMGNLMKDARTQIFSEAG